MTFVNSFLVAHLKFSASTEDRLSVTSSSFSLFIDFFFFCLYLLVLTASLYGEIKILYWSYVRASVRLEFGYIINELISELVGPW